MGKAVTAPTLRCPGSHRTGPCPPRPGCTTVSRGTILDAITTEYRVPDGDDPGTFFVLDGYRIRETWGFHVLEVVRTATGLWRLRWTLVAPPHPDHPDVERKTVSWKEDFPSTCRIAIDVMSL